MLLTFISFIVVLSLVIFVHEFGHFVAAKKLGVKVEEFGFGYPPRIFAIKRKSTEYSVNWIPFGGFVKLKGEEREKKKEEKDSLNSKKIWQRSVILSAGVIMNVFLTFFLITLGFSLGLPSILDGEIKGAKVKNPQIQVLEVLEDSPAEKADIMTGDIILSIDDQSFTKIDDLQNYNADKAGSAIMVSIKRGNEIDKKNLTLEIIDESNQGKMGAGLVEIGFVSYPLHLALYNGLKGTVYLFWAIIQGFYNIIKTAIISHQVPAEIAGPVGIAVISGQMARMGFIYILQFVAILSLTLAIINFLPFPALDGGRVLFIFIEKIRGKPVNQRLENAIHTFGFYLLLFLLIIVSFRDIQRFNVGSAIINFFKKLIGN